MQDILLKPDIDDLRELPALYIAKKITDKFENVVCVEPNISLDTTLEKLKLISLEDILQYNIIVFLVGHKEFKNLKIDHTLDFCGVLN